MSKKAALTLDGVTFELKYTMLRARKLQEASGVDVLNDNDGFGKLVRTIGGLALTLYCLAGSESKTGVTLEEFEDLITLPDDLARVQAALDGVFRRDLPKAEEADAPNASGPKRGRSKSQ